MRDVPAYPGWVAYSGPMPPLSALRPKPGFTKSGEAGFHGAFLTRMLFSCLVDADSIQTARFYGEPERSPFTPLPDLRDRLDDHLDALAAAAPRTALNDLRAEVLAHARRQAELPAGLFTLTVPTGGGKTLTSLSFALRHAARHGLRRIVTVIRLTGARIETATVRGESGPRRCRPFTGARIETGSVRQPPASSGRRPFTGARIETPVCSGASSGRLVAPSRGRGSKRRAGGGPYRDAGRPFTGARIETSCRRRPVPRRRSPLHGGADRNQVLRCRKCERRSVAPSRGRGSKRAAPAFAAGRRLGRPFTGARIETRYLCSRDQCSGRRPFTGARIETRHRRIPSMTVRLPLHGGADRNPGNPVERGATGTSPLHGGADRNRLSLFLRSAGLHVAPSRERGSKYVATRWRRQSPSGSAASPRRRLMRVPCSAEVGSSSDGSTRSPTSARKAAGSHHVMSAR